MQSPINASVEALSKWHTRPGTFQRLTPPWENVKVEKQTGDVIQGGEMHMKVKEGPITLTWIAKMFGYQENKQFEDKQVKGPFKYWHHIHKFLPNSNGDEQKSVLSDEIEFKIPFEPFSRPIGMPLVRKKLNRMFQYRHTITQNDLSLHNKYNPKGDAMKIAITGATGLVGSELVPFLQAGGHEVLKMVRNKSQSSPTQVYWNPDTGEIEANKLEGIDAMVHLAGDNVADGNWTPAKKQRIKESRTKGTKLIADTLANLQQPPKTFISASAIGYYGERGDKVMDETSSAGEGFLTDVCKEWEAACKPAKDKGIRTVNMRVGVVLSPKGSALGKMLPIFQLGGGGILGNGKQYMSWIAIDDLIGAIYHALNTPSLSGPVNGTAPNPATNSEFTKVLGKVLFRPTIAPVPGFGVKMLFGEMGETLLLGSTRVLPKALQDSGYQFLFPDLEGALRHVLGQTKHKKSA